MSRKITTRPGWDSETFKLFVALGVLTLALVFGLRWALFAPPKASIAEPPQEIQSKRP